MTDPTISACITPFDLKGRHVLVTGASAGIGRATAVLAARLGARLTLGGRDATRLEETLAQLPGEGHGTLAFDLNNLDGTPEWVRCAVAARGPIAGLAHCAGIQETRPIRSFDEAFFERVLTANLGSALALAKGLRQRNCHTERSALVFVSSIAGVIGTPGNVVYAASKGGVQAATRGLALELLRDGIRVNCVVPALVETDLVRQARVKLTAEQFQKMVDRQPLGLGQPEDVANAIAFLLCDASRWITGVLLPVDGGALAL